MLFLVVNFDRFYQKEKFIVDSRNQKERLHSHFSAKSDYVQLKVSVCWPDCNVTVTLIKLSN